MPLTNSFSNFTDSQLEGDFASGFLVPKCPVLPPPKPAQPVEGVLGPLAHGAYWERIIDW